jgi:hypothetical protein
VAVKSNDQLTDGGPSVTPESPGGVAGPPFGEAPGSAVSSLLQLLQLSLRRAPHSRTEHLDDGQGIRIFEGLTELL